MAHRNEEQKKWRRMQKFVTDLQRQAKENEVFIFVPTAPRPVRDSRGFYDGGILIVDYLSELT